MANFLDPSLKMLPWAKASSVLCENQYFFLIQMFSLLLKVIVFFSVPFYSTISIFDQPFRRLLPLFCFYGSSKWLFKVKITCKRVKE